MAARRSVSRTNPGRGSGESALPAEITPQLATLVDAPPNGDNWLHEIKYDGYRLLARIESGDVRFVTRNGNDWTARFPHFVAALRNLDVHAAWLDGEVVALEADGRSNFALLQQRLRDQDDAGLHYMLFDLLYLDGQMRRDQPLIERKRALRELLARGSGTDVLRYSDHVQGNAEVFLEHACNHQLEGIISKRGNAAYKSGRSNDWRKIKCAQRQEFVVAGYTESDARGRPFGALLLGVFEQDRLIYCGRVGTGFNARVSAELYRRLAALETRDSPLWRRPPVERREKLHWVVPELVVEVRFGNWTADGVLRHPSFQGVRDDKAAREVVRELPADGRRGAATMPVRNNGSAVKLTNRGKILYPEPNLSKADLAAYYEQVAPFLLARAANRPLTLVRCPDGYQAECFYQKHMPPDSAGAIETVAIQHQGASVRYPVLRSAAGLLAFVQLGTLEIHAWGARTDRWDRPDQITFDLDPGPQVPWNAVIEAARLLRTLLEGIGLRGFLKSTGGKGLHVVVPIQRRHGWDEVKAFAKAVAEQLVRFDAGRFTAALAKAGREQKIFIDYLRNGRGATAVVPYSTRARKGAPVAVPLSWEMLESIGESVPYTAGEPSRVLELAAVDPWNEFDRSAARLTEAMWAALRSR